MFLIPPIVGFYSSAHLAKKKALKVLGSVRNKRQARMAEAYADRAVSFLRDEGATNMCSEVHVARAKMWQRLDKPRYTLKDGVWVRKGRSQSEGGRYLGLSGGDTQKIMGAPVMMTQKEANSLRNQQMAAMAGQMAPQKGLAGAYSSGSAF